MADVWMPRRDDFIASLFMLSLSAEEYFRQILLQSRLPHGSSSVLECHGCDRNGGSNIID
jgi:hypothetical protein